MKVDERRVSMPVEVIDADEGGLKCEGECLC